MQGSVGASGGPGQGRGRESLPGCALGEATGSQAWPGSGRPAGLLTGPPPGLPGGAWLGSPLCSALSLSVSFIFLSSFLVFSEWELDRLEEVRVRADAGPAPQQERPGQLGRQLGGAGLEGLCPRRAQPERRLNRSPAVPLLLQGGVRPPTPGRQPCPGRRVSISQTGTLRALWGSISGPRPPPRHLPSALPSPLLVQTCRAGCPLPVLRLWPQRCPGSGSRASLWGLRRRGAQSAERPASA